MWKAAVTRYYRETDPREGHRWSEARSIERERERENLGAGSRGERDNACLQTPVRCSLARFYLIFLSLLALGSLVLLGIPFLGFSVNTKSTKEF